MERFPLKRISVLLVMAAVAAFSYSCEKKVEREGRMVSAKEAKRLDMAAAENAIARAEFDQAMAIYDRFLADFPKSPEVALAHQKKGEILYWQEDYRTAEAEFQFVITNYPLRPEAQDAAWGLGLCYYRQKRWDDAVAALSPIYDVTADPDRRDQVGMLLGECRIRRGNYLEAAEWYGRVAGDTDNPDNLARARRLAVKIVDEKLGYQELESLVQSFPRRFPADYALLKLARVDQEKAEMEKARAKVERLLREHKDSELLAQALSLREQLKALLIVEPHRIGLLLPLSGKGRYFGEKALQGALLAAKIFGNDPAAHPVQLRVKDVSSDPGAAAGAVEELVKEDHVIAIIGPILPQTAEAAAAKAEQLSVPLIALNFKENLPDSGSMIFRNCMTKSAQVNALLDWAMGKKGLTRFAILYPQDSYGTEFMNLFWAGVERRGGKVTAAEEYDPSKTDFGPQIRKMVGLYYLEARRRELELIEDAEAKQSIGVLRAEHFKPEIDFEAIFIPDSWKLIAMIAPQLRYYRVTGVQLLGSSGWHSDELIKNTRFPDIKDAVFADRFAHETRLSSLENYSYRFQQAFEDEPDLMDAQAYEAVELVINLIREQGIQSRSELVRALLQVKNYPGVTGRITVMPNGEWSSPVYLMTFQDKKIKPLR